MVVESGGACWEVVCWHLKWRLDLNVHRQNVGTKTTNVCVARPTVLNDILTSDNLFSETEAEDHHLITAKDRMELPRRWDHGMWKWRETKTTELVQTAKDALHECAKPFRRQLAGTQDPGNGKKSNTNWKMNASTQTITANSSQTLKTADSLVAGGGEWS